ncbi:hypothetical protein [Mitsuaria sp. GD03876]|uniref:hypothetical protein n=1 Tax=Mitsuaria sp. GD03876 TaxID=2975399 RepID=UPI0024480647|nr:hypothetical protein [Mitsuaria sp. GD03876]MDH0867722.1 hypothetical protein [Mitsuaria sp. GD03876]
MTPRFRSGDSFAEVRGFDHATFCFNWIGFVLGGFPWFAIPAFVNYPWRPVLLATAAGSMLVGVLMIPVRFRVWMSPGSLVLERSWSGLTYKRARITALDHVRFEVWGTGDWGDEGLWPCGHYCEIQGTTEHDWMIGSPGTADTLARWLTAEWHRLTPHARHHQERHDETPIDSLAS